MNKKVLLISLLLVGYLFPAMSQEETTDSRNLIVEEVEYGKPNETYNTYKTTWKKNRFKDNWEITIGGGAQRYYGEDDAKVSITTGLTLAPQLAITKYFSPIWGLRMNLTGGSLTAWNDGNSGVYRKWNNGSEHYLGQGVLGTPGYPDMGWSKNTAMLTWDPTWNYYGFTLGKEIQYEQSSNSFYYEPGRPENGNYLYKQPLRYYQANIDFMFNFFNLIGNYNPRRAFEIVPFAGVGIYNSLAYFGKDNFFSVGVHGGLIGKIRVTDRFGINLEASGSLVGDDFDGQSGDNNAMNGIMQGMIGLNFKLGKTDWEVAEPMDYELIRDLQTKINDQRADLIRLANTSCKNCPPCPELPSANPTGPIATPKTIKYLPDPVFFRIDKSVIDAPEWPKIDKAAEYLRNNPNVNVVITGYADKKTAYPAYNLKLSERRAKIVSKALIERYGVNPMRVSVNWAGDQVQPFVINEWNRVVIFVIE